MKKVLLSVLALALIGGVASADHRHGRGGGGWNRGGGSRAAVSWSGGVVVRSSAPVRVIEPRVVVRQRVVRRPIYVQRPAVTVRYYDYDRRPTAYAENYQAMPGYYWVAGQWSWTGYEWSWTAGHYEPDPRYVEPGYDSGYTNGSYYNNSGYDTGCDHSYEQSNYYDGY